MSENKTWFIIHTRSGLEKKVSELLTKRKIENFYVTSKLITKPKGKNKTFEPLLDSCIFINIIESECQTIRKINGFLNFVYWQDKPVELLTEDIYLLKQFLNVSFDLQVEKIKVDITQRAVVVNEPLVFNNSLPWENKKEYSKICLPMLGLSIKAQIEKQDVKIINLSPAKNFFRFSKLSIK